MTRAGLRWIDSGGGPLLLVPGELRLAWRGTDIPEEPVVSRFRWAGPGTPATDYDRACDVEGYVGIIPVGGGTALVLGDAPHSTAWWPLRSGGGILVRWEYAPSEERVEAALEELSGLAWEETGLTFRAGAEPVWLFDSAYAGRRAEECGYLTIPQVRGTYQIAMAWHHPDEETALLLHWLRGPE
jgi:hypothetical protein